MKNRIGIVALIVVCLGLLIGLIAVKKNASEQQEKDASTVLTYSNKWVATSDERDRQKQVNTDLEGMLEKQKAALNELTNHFTKVSATLADTKVTLTQTEASLRAAEEEVKKRDARIADLENQKEQLDRKALDLSAAITNLTVQIAATQQKLDRSEGDKAFLQAELKRLMAEKAELERQFNDLAVLRAQVAKLKEELNIARRIEWIRQGLFARADQKGAQQLLQGVSAPRQAPAVKPAYDLNVEISSDGSVKVIPPATNAPAAKPSAAK